MGKYQHYSGKDSEYLRKKIAILLIIGKNKQSICKALNISKGKLYRLRNKNPITTKYVKTQITDYLSVDTSCMSDMAKEDCVKHVWGEDYKSLCLFLHIAGLPLNEIIELTEAYDNKTERYRIISEYIEKKNYIRPLSFCDDSTQNRHLNEAVSYLWDQNREFNNEYKNNDHILIYALQQPYEHHTVVGKGNKITFRYNKEALQLLHKEPEITLIIYHWSPRPNHIDLEDINLLIRYKSVKMVISLNDDGYIGYIEKRYDYHKHVALEYINDLKQRFGKNEQAAIKRFISDCAYCGLYFYTFRTSIE